MDHKEDKNRSGGNSSHYPPIKTVLKALPCVALKRRKVVLKKLKTLNSKAQKESLFVAFAFSGYQRPLRDLLHFEKNY